MADDTTQEVTIKILGEAESFKKSVKQATKLTTDLEKLSSRYRKSGMGQAKALDKITGKHNKSQRDAGKKAFEMEKKLQKVIKDNIKEIQKQQKAFKGNALAVKEELKALKELEKQHRKIAAFRKKTGYRSMGERFGGGARAVGRGLGSGVRGVGQGVMALGGMIMGAVTAIVGTLISTVTSQIRQGYASYINYGRARAGLGGMGAFRGNGRRAFGTAMKLGFSKTETVQQMRNVGRVTGNINAVTQAQAAARSFGGDVGEVAGFMGTLTRGGQGFGGLAGKGGERTLRRVMSHAFSSGLDHSRAGEHLAAVASGVKAAQTVTGGRVNADQISAMLSFFGRSGMPGLQGAAGMAQLGKLDQTIKKAGFGGGGDPTSALIYQALGFGQAGGTASFYEATKQAQRGIFGEGGAGNLMKVWERFGQTGGGIGTQKTNIELSNATGMSLDVIESINDVILKSGGTIEAQKKIAEITKQQLPVQKQILLATQEGHLKVAERVAFLENRLVTIGEATAESIEKLQDIFNDVVDTFLPTAVVALKVIAEVVSNIWFWLKDFGRSYNESAIEKKKLAGISAERENILKKYASGEYDRAKAAEMMRQNAAKAGAARAALQDDVDPILDAYDALVDVGHRTGQAVGAIAPDVKSRWQQRQAVEAAAVRLKQRSLIDATNIAGTAYRGRALEFQSRIGQDVARIGELSGISEPTEAQRHELETLRARKRDLERRRDEAVREQVQEEAQESGVGAGLTSGSPIASRDDPASFRASGSMQAPTTYVGRGRTAYG